MRLLGIIILLITTILAAAGTSSADNFIDLQAIKAIESSGNPFAFNARTKCYGLFQISEVCLQEFNQLEKKQYQPRDLFDPAINEEIADWYFQRLQYMLSYYDVKVTVATLIASYNWGIGNVVRWYRSGARPEALPAETRDYIDKYVLLSAEEVL